MKRNLCLILSGLVLVAGENGAFSQTTTFNYQGRLDVDGAPASGSYDFEFSLYTALVGGLQIGGALSRPGVEVTNGLFKVDLDYGAAAFPGANRWLAISVRTNGAVAFSPLDPRQQVVSAPYAIRALEAGGVPTGAIGSSDIADGTVSLADLNLASVDGRYVLKAGDTMTGPLETPNLTVPGTITANSLMTPAGSLNIQSSADIEVTIDRNNSGPLTAFF